MNESMLRSWTNEQHHADLSAVSHSMLEVFRRSPVEYAARYIDKLMPAPAPTPQMILGSALHCFVLEQERYWQEYATAPDGIDRRTTDGKRRWQEFTEQNAGKTLLTEDQTNAVESMTRAICDHPEARAILADSVWRERSLVHQNLKARIDVMCKMPLIADLKTAADPSPEAFARQASNLGYHRQAAFYREITTAYRNEKCHFIFVVVQNTPPWECACYTLDASAMDLGYAQNCSTLRKLEQAMESGDWTGQQNKLVMELELPKWAFNQE